MRILLKKKFKKISLKTRVGRQISPFPKFPPISQISPSPPTCHEHRKSPTNCHPSVPISMPTVQLPPPLRQPKFQLLSTVSLSLSLSLSPLVTSKSNRHSFSPSITNIEARPLRSETTNPKSAISKDGLG